MSNVATRLLSLILLLQSRPSWKAAELADELHVSERTIHRYMSMLEEMGIPIYSERGPYGGFSLVRGYKLPPLIFSAEEATVLYMGANLVRDVWGQTYEDAVTSVTAKLDNVLPDDLRQKVDKAQQSLVVGGLTARDRRPWEAILHTLRRCIGGRCCVSLRYRNLEREETERIVEPYALTFQMGQWYLIGMCRLRQETRTFRVDRILQAAPQQESFTMPPDFSVREYWQSSMFEPRHAVVVRFSPNIAPRIRDDHAPWMEISENDDGSLDARFGASTLNWIVGWVLSYGAAATVLEPPELIARVRQAAEGALEQYGEGRTTKDERRKTDDG
jgi:predicted DNA-binding transcriptional regulator YafY